MTPRISIIIPTYNHAEELVACLHALERQTFKTFEVMVVDDGSTDGTETRIQAESFSIPVALHRFSVNRGAPAARNEGLRRTEAPFVMFLDADAELVPEALERLVSALDQNPEAAFAYSSFQFGFKVFKGRPFDAKALREKNYIHTSALIRRTAEPHFDESLKKFQDWDLFLTLAEQGKTGVWIDDVLFRVKPRKEGMSRWLPKIMFQVPWDVLGYVPREVRKYRAAEEIILAKHGLISAESRAEEVAARQRTKWWFLGILAVEILSRGVIFHPMANAVVAVCLAVGLFFLTVFHPAFALAVCTSELLIGSKGALFKIGGDENNNGGVSVRVLFFAAFVAGWVVRSWKDRAWKQLQFTKEFLPYFALYALIAYGVVRGFALGNSGRLLDDANAWAYWLLLVPAVSLVRRNPGAMKRWMVPAVLASLLWVPVKTLALFYFFGHGFLAYATEMYLWVRRTGVGEITRITANAFRIFFQSHVYAVPTLIGAFSWLGFRETRKGWVGGLISLSLATILISLSRSAWIGLVVGMMCAFGLLRWELGKWPWFAVKRFVAGTGVALAMMAFLLAVPIPPVDTSSLFGVLGSRTNMGEDAAVSRWRLLEVLQAKIAEQPILGHGFGATVTYESKDPRIVAQTGGLYTTAAFEWGWLEHWIKFGILGIPVLLWVLGSLMQRLWTTWRGTWLGIAGAASLVALAAIHVFTPYLNHPLGILFFLAGEGLIAWKRAEAYVVYSRHA